MFSRPMPAATAPDVTTTSCMPPADNRERSRANASSRAACTPPRSDNTLLPILTTTRRASCRIRAL